MRDPNRIHDTMMVVEALWNKYPDWRFMQLINNLQRSVGHDMFYTEDKQLVEIIKIWLEEIEKNKEEIL